MLERIPDWFWWAERYGGGLFAVVCLIGAINQTTKHVGISLA